MKQKPYKVTSFLRPTTLDMPGARGRRLPLVGPADGAIGIDLHLNEIKVGSGPGPTHFHRNSDNIYVVLDGRVGLGVGGDSFEATRGDVLYIPAAVEHFAGNIGDTVVSMLEIYTPPIDSGAGRDFHITAGGYDQT